MSMKKNRRILKEIEKLTLNPVQGFEFDVADPFHWLVTFVGAEDSLYQVGVLENFPLAPLMKELLGRNFPAVN